MKRLAIPVALLLVFLSHLGAPPTSRAQQRLTLTQPVDSLTFFQVYVGRTLGYFGDEGIDLEVVATAGGGPHLQAVLANRAQFTASPGTYQLNALKAGKRLVGVYDLLKRNIIGVVIHKEVAQKIGLSPTTPFADKLARLKGLTLGVTRPGALTYIMAEALIKRAGYVPNQDVRILAVGGGATIVPALQNRKVDLILISTPHPERAIIGGFGQWFINNALGEDPSLDPFMMSTLMVSPAYAEAHPDVVRKMVRALYRATQYIQKHPLDEVVRTVEPFFGDKLPPEILREAVRTVQAAVSSDGRMSPAAVRNTVRLMRGAGRLQQDFTLADVFTDRFLP